MKMVTKKDWSYTGYDSESHLTKQLLELKDAVNRLAVEIQVEREQHVKCEDIIEKMLAHIVESEQFMIMCLKYPTIVDELLDVEFIDQEFIDKVKKGKKGKKGKKHD